MKIIDKNLRDFIVVSDDMMTSDDCQHIISLFNDNPKYHEHHNTDGYNFTQLNITRHNQIHSGCKAAHDILIQATLNAVKLYKQVPESSFWPDKTALEEFRIKKYLPNTNDRFEDHIDAGDLITSKRYLVFFWYLNDVIEGGETYFPSLNLSIKPKQGRILIFPPTWMFPHRANKPISNEKYMVGSYLHFI